MSNYFYKNWEPNQGLEEQQTEVFNEANKYKFQPANAKQIKKRFNEQKINPEHVKYAFCQDKMVGYIVARVQEQIKEIVISYPWTVPNTPTVIQETLFDNMIQSFRDKDKFSDYKFRVNPFAKPKENFEFLKERGFLVANTWKELLLSMSDVAEADYNPKFVSRIGSEEDVEVLISLTKEDGSYAKNLNSDEKIREFIKDEVVPTEHVILVYENEMLKAACAPKEEEKRVIMNFAVFKEVKDQEPFIPLFVELAKACVKSGYGKRKPILVYTDNMDTPVEEQEFLKQFTPVQTEILMYYCYLENK
ncbi:MAG: hypothetical protein ACXAC6_12520 [Candidatus Hodarchaeales archaeon]|jgi:hypothetical protein